MQRTTYHLDVGLLRTILFSLIALSLAAAALPQQASAAASMKEDCCAKMTAGHEQGGDCQKHAPKTPQERQCCTACALGLAILTGTTTPLLIPAPTSQQFARHNFNGSLRSDRPPVPPPRVLFS